MRSGYTTGACAAAGAKAALLFLQGKSVQEVSLPALDGTTLLHIPIQKVEKISDGAYAEVIKDAGDDPDITQGVSVFTTVRLKGTKLVFRAGKGIGHVTKPGLSVPPGEPAINPGPRRLIAQAVESVLGLQSGCEVEISIPAGEELAKRTLNPILGIEGGLSIIGTSGVVRPMSEEGFKNSLVPQIDVAQAAGYRTLIFVPGKIGEDIAVQQCGLPIEAVVQTSNFIGFMLDAAADRGISQVLLFGHLGKLVKVAAGVFYTHNRIADARMETLAAYAGAAGMSAAEVQKILLARTTEEVLPLIAAAGKNKIYGQIAARASQRAQQRVFDKLQVGTVLVTLKGHIMGMDQNAVEMGGKLKWNIKSSL